MRRRLTTLAAFLALAIALFALAGCGNKKPGVPRGDAAELIVLLKKAQVESDDPQRCDALLATVRNIAARVRGIPSSTDQDVRDSLANGVRNLAESARTQCANTQTTTTPTVPTTETVPPPTTTETVPPPTTETTPPPTTETTPPGTTPPVPTTPPGNGTGGAGPGNGGPGNGNKRGFWSNGNGHFGEGDD